MAKTIFYAWQSDRPKSLTREFIRTAIEEAIKRLNTEVNVEDADDLDQWEIDHDTRGVTGSPPIAETICKKIDECAIFVADVTCVSEYNTNGGTTKRCVNGNVLIELGYARGKRGLANVITVQNTHFGKPEDLPFDLKHLRHPIQFDLSLETSEKNQIERHQKLVSILEDAFRDILKNVLLEDQTKQLAKNSKLQTAASATHSAFIKQLSDGNFHGIDPQNLIVAMSVIPLNKPMKKLDLSGRQYDVMDHLMHLTNLGISDENHPVVGGFIRRNFVVDDKYTLTEQAESVSMITYEGCVHSASVIPISALPNGRNRATLGIHESAIMQAGGAYIRLLTNIYKMRSPFMVAVAILGTQDVFLLAGVDVNRNPKAVEEESIQPEPCLIDFAPNAGNDLADSMDFANQFAAGIHPAMDTVWQHAGYYGDPHYFADGKFRFFG